MKAVLLAAGLGTRLKPITNSIPKCMVPINGKPLLDYWLEILVPNSEIEQIFINVSYLKEIVVEHLKTTWSHSNKIVIWHEEKLLGTAGTLNQNVDELSDSDTLVIHADNLSSFNLEHFISAHNNRPPNSVGTLMLFKTDSPQSCGIVELNDQGQMLRMHEKVNNPPGNLANGAVYIFTSKIIDWIVRNNADDISGQVIPAFEGQLNTWLNDTYHRDIGNAQSYALAQQEFTKIVQSL